MGLRCPPVSYFLHSPLGGWGALQFGEIAQERGDFAEAEDWYHKSLAICEKIGDEHGQAIALHQLGMISEEQGSFDEAEAFYHQAEAILQRMNDPYHLDMTQQALKRVREKRDT